LFDEICGIVGTEIKASEGFGQILQELVKDEELINCLSSQRFIDMHEQFKTHLNQDDDETSNLYRKLVKFLIDDGLIGYLANEPINRQYGYAYYTLISEEDADSGVLEKKLDNELKSAIETNIWHEELCNNLCDFGILDVVIELIRKSYKVNLGYKFTETLLSHAKAVLSEEASIDNLEDSWSLLLKAITNPERKRFRGKLLEVINEANESISPLLKIYGDEIEMAVNEVGKTKKYTFVRDTCLRIAEDGNETERHWMLRLFSSNEDIISSTRKSDVDMLRARLEEYLKDEYAKEAAEGDSEQIEKGVIDNVAKQLEIELVAEEPEPKPEDGNGKLDEEGELKKST